MALATIPRVQITTATKLTKDVQVPSKTTSRPGLKSRPTLIKSRSISQNDDEFFPTLNIPLRSPNDIEPVDEKNRSNMAVKAVQKGYFRQTSKYILPSLNGDVDKLYRSGKMMTLDKKAMEGLKAHLAAKQKPKPRLSTDHSRNAEFVKQLQQSFSSFDSKLEQRKTPSRRTLSRQASILSKTDNRSNALKLALDEERKFEKKRKAFLNNSLENLAQLSSRSQNQQTKQLRRSNDTDKKTLQRQNTRDLHGHTVGKKKYAVKPGKPSQNISKHSQNALCISKESLKPADSDTDLSRDLSRKNTAATIAKVRSAVRKIGPLLASVNRVKQPPVRARRTSVINQVAQGLRRKRIRKQVSCDTDMINANTGGRKIKMLAKGDRRSTMANLNEVDFLSQSDGMRFMRMGDARDYFVKSIKRIMIILCWWEQFSMQYQTMENQMKTFFDMAQEIEQQTTMAHIQQATGLAFDHNDYKASKEINLSIEIKRILTLPPYSRTSDQVNKVMTGLQSLKSFAEYPIHMQEKLAKVAWFQEVSPKRVILRQGHFAENFYFILSGYAVVKIILKKGRSVSLNVVARLVKGQSFGEIALLHHSQRTATVESANHMTMLSIDRDDFLEIFFNMKDGEEPEHVSFCRNIPFLKNWPMDKVHENPGSCMFHFFRRGTIVIPDSTKNEWIYIVKTGSCRILKRLMAVESERTWSSAHAQDMDAELQYKYGAIVYEPRIDNRRQKDFNIEVISPVNRAITEFFKTETRASAGPAKARIRRSKTRVSFDDGPNTDQDLGVSEDRVEKAEHADTEPSETSSVPDAGTEKKAGFSKSRVNDLLNHRDRDAGVLKKPMPQIKKRGRSPEKRSYVRPAVPTHSSFIELRKLREKDVFGLEDVEFEDEYYDNPKTSVMLVSDGAELIMLSRKLFIKHSNEFVRQYVREHVKFFPDDEVLQENLQTKVNWDLFRSEELVTTLMELHDKKSLDLLNSWA